MVLEVGIVAITGEEREFIIGKECDGASRVCRFLDQIVLFMDMITL